jgi:hypothetical protein
MRVAIWSGPPPPVQCRPDRVGLPGNRGVVNQPGRRRPSARRYHPHPRAVSSAGRAPALQAGGHWFEPSTAHRRFACTYGRSCPRGASAGLSDARHGSVVEAIVGSRAVASALLARPRRCAFGSRHELGWASSRRGRCFSERSASAARRTSLTRRAVPPDRQVTCLLTTARRTPQSSTRSIG